MKRSLSYRVELRLLQQHSDFGPGGRRGHRPDFPHGHQKDLRRSHWDLGRMHADQQVPVTIGVADPAVDQVISGLEIQAREWFVDTKKKNFSSSRDDFGK